MANEFELAEAYTEFTVRDAKFQSGLKSVQASLARTKQRMLAVSRAAKVMLLAGAGALVLFVKEASDAEETIGKFNAVFKEQAAATEAWADSFSEDVGRSRFAVMGFLSTLQDTFVPLGFAREEAAGFAQTLTTLGVDLASFNNASEPETINLLTSALTGSHEAVRRFGVIITVATLNQELMNMGIEGGIRAATEQEKVLARMNLILQSTADAQGDAKRTAGSLANQMKALHGAYVDVAVEVGKVLVPAVKDLVAWLKSHKEVIANTIIVVVEFLRQYGLMIIKVAAVIFAVRTFIKILLALQDAYRAAAAAQAILLTLQGPRGWVVLAASALVAVGALVAVDQAYDNIAEGATAAMEAAEEANKEMAKTAKLEEAASKRRADTTGKQGDTVKDDVAARTQAAQEVIDTIRLARQLGFTKLADETQAQATEIASRQQARRAGLDDPVTDPDILGIGTIIGDAMRGIEQTMAVARADLPAAQKEIAGLQFPRAVGGAVDITQLQAKFQQDTLRRDQEKMKWAKDTAMTLQEMHKEGITIANLDDFNPAFWEK